MNVDAYRDFRLLTELAADVSVTQRELAKKFGLALGLTNFLIRRLVRKGYVQVVSLERKRLRYLLTPKGVAAKARLTYDYLDYSLGLYRAIRTFLAHALSAIVQSGRKEAVLVGTGEVAEIVFLILQQHGVRVTAVADEPLNGQRVFMNQPVKTLAEISRGAGEWVVIASFKDTRQILQRVSQWGVPKERVISIPAREGQMAGAPAASPAMPDAMETVGAHLL